MHCDFAVMIIESSIKNRKIEMTIKFDDNENFTVTYLFLKNIASLLQGQEESNSKVSTWHFLRYKSSRQMKVETYVK